jgi:hypothetical protein
MSEQVDDGTIPLVLGHPMILEVSPMTFWLITYTGPSSASKCIALQVTYVNGGLVTSYTLNLALEQIFYLEPIKCLCRLALVKTHYESITLEKLKEVKK